MTVLERAAARAREVPLLEAPELRARRLELAAQHLSSSLLERFGAPVSSTVSLHGAEYVLVEDLVVVLSTPASPGGLVPPLPGLRVPYAVVAAPPALGLLPGSLRLHTLEVSSLEDLALVWARRPRLEFDASLVLGILSDGQVPHMNFLR